MTIYDFDLTTIDHKQIHSSTYKNKVLLIVNVASKCGFAEQFSDLQNIYEKYKNQDFEILAFPSGQFLNQEFESNKEIQSFCVTKYSISFTMFEKTDVKGKNAHPLFKYLTANCKKKMLNKKIKWNFEKFLVNRSGEIVSRYSSAKNPWTFENDIVELLKKSE